MRTEPELVRTTGTGLKNYMIACHEILHARTVCRNNVPRDYSQLEDALATNNPEALQNGYQYEVLFLACLFAHSPYLDIRVSNANEDHHGTDFIIDDIKVDVTTHLKPDKMIRDTCRKKDYSTIFIPPREHYGNPFHKFGHNSKEQDSYYTQFLDKKIDAGKFLKHIYTTNLSMLKTIKQFKEILANKKHLKYSHGIVSFTNNLDRELQHTITKTPISMINQKIEELNCIFKEIDSSILSN
ncbi:hypothetical protein K8R20_01685 [bacterium]|nr:hypothetical protein [bacterium]